MGVDDGWGEKDGWLAAAAYELKGQGGIAGKWPLRRS